MTKQQKIKIAAACAETGIRVTSEKLSKLEYERKNRRDLDRFFFARITLNAAS